jgi:hypothetical protein
MTNILFQQVTLIVYLQFTKWVLPLLYVLRRYVHCKLYAKVLLQPVLNRNADNIFSTPKVYIMSRHCAKKQQVFLVQTVDMGALEVVKHPALNVVYCTANAQLQYVVFGHLHVLPIYCVVLILYV